MKTKPIILAIETATDACSVALSLGDTLLEKYEVAPKSHTRIIIPMMQGLLTSAELNFSDLDAIAVGRGPGSFTGVRIAVSLAQGLGFGLQCPIYPISTLQTLAWQASCFCDSIHTQLIIPALDARMQEIYVSHYKWQHGVLLPLGEEKLCKPHGVCQQLTEKGISLIGIGSGWDSYGDLMADGVPVKKLLNRYPQARDIALIAEMQWEAGVEGIKAQEVLPIYLRDEVAKPTQKN